MAYTQEVFGLYTKAKNAAIFVLMTHGLFNDVSTTDVK